MARLIPGRIRNQGIALYDQGLVKIVKEEKSQIEAQVDCQKVTYGVDDDAITCQCDFFARKKYCQHIAALEYFLKNDPNGKVISEQFTNQSESKEETKK